MVTFFQDQKPPSREEVVKKEEDAAERDKTQWGESFKVCK
jgi:hypothetical protein